MSGADVLSLPHQNFKARLARFYAKRECATRSHARTTVSWRRGQIGVVALQTVRAAAATGIRKGRGPSGRPRRMVEGVRRQNSSVFATCHRAVPIVSSVSFSRGASARLRARAGRSSSPGSCKGNLQMVAAHARNWLSTDPATSTNHAPSVAKCPSGSPGRAHKRVKIG